MRNLLEYPVTDNERVEFVKKICEQDPMSCGNMDPVIAKELYEKAQIAIAIEEMPEGWKIQWHLHSPGYDAGKLIADYRCDIHADVSSGGGPKVKGFGTTPANAIRAAIKEIEENWKVN